MAPSKATLKKLYNEEIVSLALDYYHKFDSKLASIKMNYLTCKRL